LTHWTYLPFLLVWALPVIVMQWMVGGRLLWHERGKWIWIAPGLCIYFTLADVVAINTGIWHFDTASLAGLWLGPVPIEEVIFYLLTATMLVQGFVITWRGKK